MEFRIKLEKKEKKYVASCYILTSDGEIIPLEKVMGLFQGRNLEEIEMKIRRKLEKSNSLLLESIYRHVAMNKEKITSKIENKNFYDSILV
ncbi:MAG: hypothetical protein KatS3mg068_1547 [Candidatus Sericytochromatia bacterium]|nr:MAG: hypothetical protein KatS3mg068_1547 [Candidatus Sericytochromatia bacterium]